MYKITITRGYQDNSTELMLYKSFREVHYRVLSVIFSNLIGHDDITSLNNMPEIEKLCDIYKSSATNDDIKYEIMEYNKVLKGLIPNTTSLGDVIVEEVTSGDIDLFTEQEYITVNNDVTVRFKPSLASDQTGSIRLMVEELEYNNITYKNPDILIEHIGLVKGKDYNKMTTCLNITYTENNKLNLIDDEVECRLNISESIISEYKYALLARNRTVYDKICRILCKRNEIDKYSFSIDKVDNKFKLTINLLYKNGSDNVTYDVEL